MNRSSRNTPEIIKFNLEIPELKKIIKEMKKLTYAIGCFNSYSSALMKMIDYNTFGFNFCLQEGGIDGGKRVKVSRMKEEDETEIHSSSAKYLEKVRKYQIEMVEKIFRVINQKLTKLEAHLIKEMPEIIKIFEKEKILRMEKLHGNKRSARLRNSAPEIIPKLYEYIADSNISKPKRFKLTFQNIIAFRYSYCSDLLFLINSQNTIIVYDLFQMKVCQEISQWPWRIRDLIIRRNLNFYNSKSILRVEFNKLDTYVETTKIDYENSKVTENDILNFAYNVLDMNEYFNEFSNTVWFHKNNKRDNYIMAFQFEKKNQLIFFYYCYKFRKLEDPKRKKERNGNSLTRGKSMMNLSRSVTLHKQKKSRMSKMFTKQPTQK